MLIPLMAAELFGLRVLGVCSAYHHGRWSCRSGGADGRGALRDRTGSYTIGLSC
jgi:hypothetical protein